MADAQASFNFKQVMRGYDKEEVETYIKDLNNYKNVSLKMYEQKVDELKEKLVLSNRERDALRVQLEVIRAVERAGQAGEHLRRHVDAVGVVHLPQQLDALREQRFVVGLVDLRDDLPQVSDALPQQRRIVRIGRLRERDAH